MTAMTNNDGLFPGAEEPLLILDAWAYAQRLLLRGGPIPWLAPNEFEAFYRQWLGLLRPSVATLNLDALIEAHLARRPQLREHMAARQRPTYPLRVALADEELALALASLVEATTDARARRPLLLSMSAPVTLLARLHRHAHGVPPAALGEDDPERAAVYLAEFIGRAVPRAVAGVLLVDEEGTADHAHADSFSPLVNLCSHQRWKLLLATRAAAVPAQVFDAVLDGARWSTLAPGVPAPALADGVHYLRIDAQMAPQEVLQALADWRSQVA